uniref:NAD(P)-dependent oxidoreductase n=1 Tax=Globicatella sulfidifaciens TaxID=136093 RepID=UPI0023F10739|nr:NAD(P)-dependent oxidoreductase [Globicatella sulfidifaciens]
MKILISDYPDSMMPTHELEKEILNEGLNNPEIVVHDYSDDNREAFLKEIEDADALLTAFIKIDEEVFARAKKLKHVSLNATGYDNIDLEAAKRYNVGISPVGEYCTTDVAEFTISVIVALIKDLKKHTYNVEKDHIWQYDAVFANKRINEMVLGVVGFGRIGRAVAMRARNLGMRVVATDIDPSITNELAIQIGVELVEPDELFAVSDVIANHMNLNETNHNYFDKSVFKKMAKKPYFINMGRGACVVEEELIEALDKGMLRGAAVDVLSDETPDLEHHPLVGRSNVIVTPHAAFFSDTSVRELQRLSTQNIVYYLNGQIEKVFKLVTD